MASHTFRITVPSMPPSKPPAKRRSFVQGRSLQVQCEEASRGVALDLQRRSVHALSGLSSIAPKLCLVLAQPYVECDDLGSIGFSDVLTTAQFKDLTSQSGGDCRIPEVDGIVLLNVGADFKDALAFVEVVDHISSLPPCIAVLVSPCEESSEDWEKEMEYARSFLEAGADDVMTIHGERTVSSLRVRTSFLRMELTTTQLACQLEEARQEIAKVKARTVRSLGRKLIRDLAAEGNLESVPALTEDLVAKEGCCFREYSLTSQIGTGTFGAVFQATHPERGVCAMKIMAKRSMRSICDLLTVDRELGILLNLAAHPNVVPAYEALHMESQIILVMGYVGKLSLHRFVCTSTEGNKDGTLPPGVVKSFCGQLAGAVAHLHANQVCHRDVNPKNFTVSDDASVVRLTDFGSACACFGYGHKLQRACGALPFVAPEVVRMWAECGPGSEGYCGPAADVWSLGVVFVELGYGLFSMERLLRWLPCPPSSFERRWSDLEAVPQLWPTAPQMCVAGLREKVGRMVLARPGARWPMAAVCEALRAET